MSSENECTNYCIILFTIRMSHQYFGINLFIYRMATNYYTHLTHNTSTANKYANTNIQNNQQIIIHTIKNNINHYNLM